MDFKALEASRPESFKQTVLFLSLWMLTISQFAVQADGQVVINLFFGFSKPAVQFQQIAGVY